MMDEKGLLRLKKEIEEAKQKASELKGQKDLLLKELKEKYGCSSVKEANQKMKTLLEEMGEIEARMEEELGTLEREYQQIQ
jgi:predicted transcriptional regulator